MIGALIVRYVKNTKAAYEVIVSSIPVGIIVVGKEGVVKYANEFATQPCGVA